MAPSPGACSTSCSRWPAHDRRDERNKCRCHERRRHRLWAIDRDGEHYWDGGFMGNPVIFPLIYNRGSKDVILVHINPIERSGNLQCMDEISFNSSLMREMRAVAFVTKLIDDIRGRSSRQTRLREHP